MRTQRLIRDDRAYFERLCSKDHVLDLSVCIHVYIFARLRVLECECSYLLTLTDDIVSLCIWCLKLEAQLWWELELTLLVLSFARGDSRVSAAACEVSRRAK